jgi:hypothetical protein
MQSASRGAYAIAGEDDSDDYATSDSGPAGRFLGIAKSGFGILHQKRRQA